MKITYFNKREIEKRVRGVILGQKLTLNHPSLVDEGEEIRVSADGLQKREAERGNMYMLYSINNDIKMLNYKILLPLFLFNCHILTFYTNQDNKYFYYF